MYPTPKGIGTKHPRRRKTKVDTSTLTNQIASFQSQGGSVTRIDQGVSTFDAGLLLCKCGCAGRVFYHKEEDKHP